MTDDQVHPTTAAQWRRWLEKHHGSSGGVWLVSWRTHTGKAKVPYEDAVTEALAFGWIDSKARTLDDDRSVLWFCPRKPTSGWSRPNKRRVERLLAEGRMAPAGQAAIDTAKANGAWELLDAVEDLVVPPDLATAFGAPWLGGGVGVLPAVDQARPPRVDRAGEAAGDPRQAGAGDRREGGAGRAGQPVDGHEEGVTSAGRHPVKIHRPWRCTPYSRSRAWA